MNRSYLQGTPWHEEQMKRTCKEGSKHCLYNKNICTCLASRFHHKKCVGKGLCDEFESKGNSAKVISEKTIIIKQNPQNSRIDRKNNTSTLETIKFKQYQPITEDENMEIENAINFAEDDNDDVEIHETPEERFVRVSLNRIKTVTEDLRKISNLSNKGRYSYTDEQINKMFDHIDRAVKRARESFNEKEFMEDFSWDD